MRDQLLCLEGKGEGIHKRVREAHFGSVDDAIPYTFHQCEDVMILWV